MIIPSRLKVGDTIAVISPSLSLSIVSEENIAEAVKVFEEKLGLKVVFGKNARNTVDSYASPLFDSSTIEDRISDLHWAFSDPSINAIFTSIGGFNSHELLPHIDYDLIRNNPKILCGYSDITAIQIGIFAHTSLVTYSGPHFSTMAMRYGNNYTIDNLKTMLFGLGDQEISLEASYYVSDDEWYKNQEKREIFSNGKWHCCEKGKAEGMLFGGNLTTLRLLVGTPHWPKITVPIILFVEEDDMNGENTRAVFLQNLVALSQACSDLNVVGILVGRLKKIKAFLLDDVICRAFPNVPCIANVDFGHMSPILTIPNGCTARMDSIPENCSITILHPESNVHKILKRKASAPVKRSTRLRRS